MRQRKNKTKKNKLAIYLIKPEFRELEDIVTASNISYDIDGIGTFFFAESRTNKPKWLTDFFGDNLANDINIFTANARGVLVVPITMNENNVHFAITFGIGRFMLQEGVTEERFGLKVVLNSIHENSFRTIDKTTLGSVPKQSREQMSRDVSPAEFGLDVEQDLVSLVTARSRDVRLGKIITGKDAIYASTSVDITNIIDFLKHCYSRYNCNEYKEYFDWIDQIAEVRNKYTEDILTNIMINNISNNILDKIWMAVPEIIDWSDINGFRYLRKKRAELHDDLDINVIISSLNTDEITANILKSSRIFAISAKDDSILFTWSAFKCMYAEIKYDNKTFMLNNGKWYEIANDFADQVEKDYISVNESKLSLPEYSSGDEITYNTTTADLIQNACCMDNKTIPFGGAHNKIEFCDIFTNDNKIIHIKKYGNSSVLSHLFSQGLVSGELFAGSEEFRKKLNDILPNTHKLSNPVERPNTSKYEIIYAIISRQRENLEIPFFSKVSLRNARRRLQYYGYDVSKRKILAIATNTNSD